MNFDPLIADFGLMFAIPIIMAILAALVHIGFAVAVYLDATRLKRRQALVIAEPIIWCLATLVGGVIAAGIYWAIHYSRLNPKTSGSSTDTDETEV